MTNMNVAVTIWWKSILLNAAFTGVWSVFEFGTGVVAIMMAMVVFGFIITLPMLPLVGLLLRLQRCIPYGSRERITWFSFALVLMVWVFYTIIQLFILRTWPPEETLYYAVGSTTSAAVLTATYFTRRSFFSLPVISSDDNIITDYKSISRV